MFKKINTFIINYVRILEMGGVLMRIASFTLISWMGPASPFLFVWILNTCDAVILSWCAIVKRDAAYTLLNLFWIPVGVVGIFRAMDMLH